MSDSSAFPFCFGAAFLSAASIVPSIWIYTELLMGPCGDGLCGFWESILLWGFLTLATFVLVGIGFLRGERALWLAALAILALGAPLVLFGALSVL